MLDDVRTRLPGAATLFVSLRSSLMTAPRLTASLGVIVRRRSVCFGSA